jgi:hypothetical protein
MSLITQYQKINFKRMVKAPWLTVLVAVLLVSSDLFAQSWTYSTLTRGKLWSTMSNSLRKGGNAVDPGSVNFTLDYPGYSKGTSYSDALNYAEAAGFAIYGEKDGTAFGYTVNSRFYPSSQYVSILEDEELTQNYNFVDPTTPAEEIATGGQTINNLGLDVRHKSMVWSIPKYESFIIHEITLTNSGTTEVKNVHFGMRYGLQMTQRSGTFQDEKYGWDEQRQAFYFYDDRSFNFEDESIVQWNFGVGPERGDLFDAEDIYEQGSRYHELDAPGFFSAVVLDAAGGNVYQNILEYIGQSTSTSAPNEDVIFRTGVDESARYLEVMTHQQPRGSWDDLKAASGEGGNKYERQPEFLISCGAYNIAPGQTVTLVFAEVMGEMDRAKIVAGGVENIDANKVLGLQALQNNIDAAKELYANNYFPVKYPPTTPTDGENSLELTPIGSGVKIAWTPISDNYTDPATGENDFAGYRVYRSNYFTIGPWTQVADIPESSAVIEDGKVVYSDLNLPQGVGVYYTVTSYDKEGNESGKVNNNRQPVYPLLAPNDDLSKKVYVVPNPFRQHSRLMGSGEQYRMEFINIPSKCNIKIYTMVGELVKEIQHDDGSGSASWGSVYKLDYMLNNWMLAVAPGVYIFRVENQVDGHKGEDYIGKFAIIK